MIPALPPEPPALPPAPATMPLSGPAPAMAATSFSSTLLGLAWLRLGAILRPKTLLQLGAVACVFVVITRISVRPEHPKALADWAVEVFTFKILPLICLVTGGGFLRNEIRNHTIEYIWTRPARKSHLALSAYASSVVFAFAQSLLFTGAIYGTAAYSGFDGIWAELPRLLFTQFACVMAFTAIAVALGVISGKFMILGVCYGFVVEVGISKIPTALSLVSVIRHARAMLTGDFASALGGGLGCLVIAAVALSVAVVVFSTRQYEIKED